MIDISYVISHVIFHFVGCIIYNITYYIIHSVLFDISYVISYVLFTLSHGTTYLYFYHFNFLFFLIDMCNKYIMYDTEFKEWQGMEQLVGVAKPLVVVV